MPRKIHLNLSEFWISVEEPVTVFRPFIPLWHRGIKSHLLHSVLLSKAKPLHILLLKVNRQEIFQFSWSGFLVFIIFISGYRKVCYTRGCSPPF